MSRLSSILLKCMGTTTYINDRSSRSSAERWRYKKPEYLHGDAVLYLYHSRSPGASHKHTLYMTKISQ